MVHDSGADGVSELQLGPSAPDVDSDINPWAWAETEYDEAAAPDLSGTYVTAVLVALDADRWLDETLSGLAAAEVRPQRLIAIDNASTDSTRRLLDQAVAVGLVDAVYDGETGQGFGASVRSALTQDRASRAQDTVRLRSARGRSSTGAGRAPVGADAPDSEHSWLWLLHDDAVPEPDTLRRLLEHVVTDEHVDITGPKLLLPKRRNHAQQLSEVGVSIAGTGRRDLRIDTGEIDQGQRDKPAPVLGVSTCGMLVRQTVWSDLDGLDRAVPVFRDGVEFGWRAQLSGYRVVTTPRAVMVHRQVGRAGLRPSGVAGTRPARLDRELGMLVVAGHAPASRLWLVWLRLVWSCLLHAVGYLLGKVPHRSADELGALGWFLTRPGQIRAFRRRVADIDIATGAEERVDALLPPWWSSLRVASETVTGVVSDRYRSVAGDHDDLTLDELTSDDFGSASEDAGRGPWFAPVVVTGVLCVIAALFAVRGLFEAGSLVAPTLLPAPETLGAIWHRAISPIPGAPFELAPPWIALTALGSTVLAGQPEWFVTLLICGVVPIALVSAYPVIRRAVSDRRVRLWVALTYALLPVLLGGTNQGRLTLSVVAISLPLLALAVRAIVLRRPRTPEAWRGGWGAGVVLVAMVAFEPSLIVFAAVVGLIGAISLRRQPRKARRVLIALAVPLVVLAPWWPGVIADWGRLFTGPDSSLDGAPSAPIVWRLLLGRDVGDGMPPLWLGAVVFGVVWVVALVGIARRPRFRPVRAGWVAALVSFAMAVLLSRLVVSVPPAGSDVRPYVGTYLLIGFAALLLAAGAGVDGLSADLANRSFSVVQPLAVVATALVGIVTLAGAGWWVLAGAAGPVDRVRTDAIPPYVLNAMDSDTGVRTLAIDLAGPGAGAVTDRTRAGFAVLADDQIRLGDADRGYTFGGSTAAVQQTEDLVVRLVAGTGDSDIASQLRDLGIGYLWVTGSTEQERSRIDNTPGLGAASGNDLGIVWQIEPAVTRASVVSGADVSGITSGAIMPAGAQGRLLRLGEAAGPGWRATLDGQELTAVQAAASPGGADGSWQQTYALPASGGVVEFHHVNATPWLLGASGLVLLVAIVLAAPAIRRPEVRDPARSARRAATVSGANP